MSNAKARAEAIQDYKQSDEYIKECVQRYLKGKADGRTETINRFEGWLHERILRTIPIEYEELLTVLEQMKEKK